MGDVPRTPYLYPLRKPLAFYSDKATVFRNNNKGAKGGDGYTQFGRAMFDLNIESICANSSQAKGRVERANLTLQDRLVKEMRLLNISTMAAGNEYAPTFIADFNRRFAKPPRNDFDVHRLVRADEDLTLIFAVHDKRQVSARLTKLASVNETLRTEMALLKAIAEGKVARGAFGERRN